MGKYDGILIASDFDHTLTDSAGRIPAANHEAIRAFMDGGGRFTVCSGRSVPMFRKKRPMFEANAPIILYNGAVCYDFSTETAVFGSPLPNVERLARTLIERYHLPNVETQGIIGHSVFCIQESRLSMQRELGVSIYDKPYDQIEEPTYMLFLGGDFIRPDDTSKDFLFNTPEIDRLFTECIALVEATGELTATRSTPLITEAMARGVSKGSAARRLCKLLHCDTLVCVGDAMNDETMLVEADRAFAPSDGNTELLEKLKDKLEIVAPCTVGTLADVIARL